MTDLLKKNNKSLRTKRNIAKSGEVLNWSIFHPFQPCVGLTRNHSQSASCHIANVSVHCKKTADTHLARLVFADAQARHTKNKKS